MNIPYGKQSVSEADIQAVTDVLGSPFLTQGPVVPKFEESVCDYVNAKFGVATNSATSALHLAVRALNLMADDLVWTSPITFVATANSVRYCGGQVDFVDIDPETFNMCPKALERKLEMAAINGGLPKIVIPVHMAGQSSDMAAIWQLSKKYGFGVIEDASHAIGAEYKGGRVGSCQFSDITVFSFHPVKIITTGEGGMAVTNDESLADRLRLLRSHGVTRDTNAMQDQEQGEWYYEMHDLGFNYRLTDIQAALGLSQMGKLSNIIGRRGEIARKYHQKLNHENLQMPLISPECMSAFHLFIVRLKEAYRRPEIFQALRDSGIGVNVHYIPVHLHPYYKALGFQSGDFPIAEDYYARAISIPMFPSLTDDEQDFVVNTLNQQFE